MEEKCSMMVLKKNITHYSKMPEQLGESEESNDNDKAISKSRIASSSPLSLDSRPRDSL